MAVLFIIYALGTYSVEGMASPVGYMLVALEPAMKHIIGRCPDSQGHCNSKKIIFRINGLEVFL